MQVKVFFLSPSQVSENTIRAIDDYSLGNNLISLSYEYYQNNFEKKNTIYQLLNQIINIYEQCSKNYDYVIILNNNTGILNFDKFFNQLNMIGIKNNIFAFRIANVMGVTMKYGPRIPYIDDSIIVLNIIQANVKRYFDRKLINASHFYAYGKNHALLQSLIENSLSQDEFMNIMENDYTFDEYGNVVKYYFPFPYSICTKSSLVNADTEFNYKYIELLEQNRDSINHEDKYVFFKENKLKIFLISSMQKINNLIRKFENKEFQKSYSEK